MAPWVVPEDVYELAPEVASEAVSDVASEAAPEVALKAAPGVAEIRDRPPELWPRPQRSYCERREPDQKDPECLPRAAGDRPAVWRACGRPIPPRRGEYPGAGCAAAAEARSGAYE